MTVYPNDLDSDLELPPIEDGVTEISADSINSIRDAVLAIEKTIGVNPQGNKNTLADRINVSIDDDGLIKASALNGIGLVSLPITDTEIAVNAAIQETKLDLDYGTSSLKSLIDSSKTNITALQSGVSTLNNSFNEHILGTNYFHDGYSISLSEDIHNDSDVESALHNIANSLADHETNSNTTHHPANTISVDTSSFSAIIDRSATDVQAALESIDSSAGALGVSHTDIFHSSGIFKEISSSRLYNTQQLVLPENAVTYVEDYDGYGIVTFPDLLSFSGYTINVGDILYVHDQTGLLDEGAYQIRSVGPIGTSDLLGSFPALGDNQISVFHIFQETKTAGDGVTAEIFKPSFVSNDSCPLACAIRNNESIVDTISIMHPHAARVKSIGFNSSVLSIDGYQLGITVGIGDDLYRTICVRDLNIERLSTTRSLPVNSKSVAERINAYVSGQTDGYHFPITAYRIGDELAIAHNWVGEEYTLEILDGYSGNFALGLDEFGSNVAGVAVRGNIGDNYSVNGKSLAEIETLFSGYADLDVTSSTFALYDNDDVLINPLEYGIVEGSIMHVSGHPRPDSNGSYAVFTSTTSTVSVFDAEEILGPATFDVSFSAADVALSLLTNANSLAGLAQVYINSNESVLLHQRLVYNNIFGSAFQITNASSGFPIGDVTVYVDTGDPTYNSFYLVNDTLSGEVVDVNKGFTGSFKLYHSNNLDYFVINIVPGTLVSDSDTVTVASSLPEDEAMLLCTACFNGDVEISNIIDNRLFGNIGVNKVRDDLVEFLSQRPVAELRSDGVVRGFEIANAKFSDSITDMVAIPLTGGVAYVNGVRIATETQKVIIRSFYDDGTAITATKTIGLNEFGTIQVFDYDLSTLLSDGYETTSGKALPLYSISIINGIVNGPTAVTDIRRFINTLDNKIELIVDNSLTNLVGNFRTLEGALLYARNYPSGEKLIIRILNTVYPSVALSVPDGVSIMGSIPYGGSVQQIVNQSLTSQTFITLEGNNRLENIKIYGSSGSLNGNLVCVTGSNINIEKCSLGFGSAAGSNTDDIAISIVSDSSQNIRIVNNLIDTVHTGIYSAVAIENLFIDGNNITNISGISAISNGININCGASSINDMCISNNNIQVSTATTADVRGIMVIMRDAYTVGVLKIIGNNIAGTSATNGIVIDNNSGASTGAISKLFINNNTIDGINYDDNSIYGIYISNTTNAFINGNVLTNIGYGSSANYGIYIENDDILEFANITGNTVKNSNLFRGIFVDAQTSTNICKVNISNNILTNIGYNASATGYIYGTASYSTILNNVLVGPGINGIYWGDSNCAQCKISGNTLNNSGSGIGLGGADYSFSNYAIYAEMSDSDIDNNTILGMYDGSNGISNSSNDSDRLKIINNTISGTDMVVMLDLFGDGHIVGSNRFYNDGNDNNAICMQLDTVTTSLIMGNLFSGDFDNAIYSDSVVTNLTITNNTVVGAPAISSIKLDNAGVVNCLIMGNTFPDGTGGSAEDNLINTAGNYGANTIGVNKDFQDTRGISVAEGQASFDVGDDTQITYWNIVGSNNFWQVNFDSLKAAGAGRRLFFPISGLPNGCKLDSVIVQGTTSSAPSANELTMTLFKQSISSPFTASSFGTSTGITGTGGFTSTTGKVVGSGEVLNYNEYNYYLEIKQNTEDDDGVNIYGATVKFTY